MKKALELDPSNEELIKYFEEVKVEFEDDHSIADDNPEK
jgi:hypothetical protein